MHYVFLFYLKKALFSPDEAYYFRYKKHLKKKELEAQGDQIQIQTIEGVQNQAYIEDPNNIYLSQAGNDDQVMSF